jgi:hypothetical protein
MADYKSLLTGQLVVTFPESERKLLKRIITTCPKEETLTHHARNLLQLGLDCTASNGRKK